MLLFLMLVVLSLVGTSVEAKPIGNESPAIFQPESVPQPDNRRIIGLIGVAARDLFKHSNATFPPSTGECLWAGTAPVCSNNACPPNYDTVRWAMSSPEGGFGGDCGAFWAKNYCCRDDSADPTWAGRWARSTTGEVMRCTHAFVLEGQPCGRLECLEGDEHKEFWIEGAHCDGLVWIEAESVQWDGTTFKGATLVTRRAKAAPGLIQLPFSENDRYYKIK